MAYLFLTIGSNFPHSKIIERSADELGVTEATLSLIQGFTSNPNITCSLVPSQWPTAFSSIQYPKLFIPGESPTWNVDWTPQDINSVNDTFSKTNNFPAWFRSFSSDTKINGSRKFPCILPTFLS